MGVMKPRTVICAICHGTFESAGPNAKNCPACRKIARQNASRKFTEAHRKPTKPAQIEDGDTPVQRAICLSCDVPATKCKGRCDKLKDRTGEALRRCPFCGGEAEAKSFVAPVSFKELHYITCTNEDCPVAPETKAFPLKELAVWAWQSRAGEEEKE